MRFANQLKSKKAWELRQLDGDIKVAKLVGKSATVFVPLTAAQAGNHSVRIRVKQAEEGTLSLRVNENKDINVKVAAGWVSASAVDTCSRRSGTLVSSNSGASTGNFSMTHWRIAALTQKHSLTARSRGRARRGTTGSWTSSTSSDGSTK